MAFGLAQNAAQSTKGMRFLRDAWENGARVGPTCSTVAKRNARFEGCVGKLHPEPGRRIPQAWGPEGVQMDQGGPRRSQKDCRRPPEGSRRALRERPPKESGSRTWGGPPCRSPGEPAQKASRGPSEDPLESQGGSNMFSGRHQGVAERQEAPQRARPSSGGVLRLSSAFFPRLRLQVYMVYSPRAWFCAWACVVPALKPMCVPVAVPCKSMQNHAVTMQKRAEIIRHMQDCAAIMQK